jgi:uncharacterized membrane protein YozB (DUF420 family)
MKSRSFFQLMSLVMLALIVFGFGANSVVNFDKMPPPLMIIIVHGILMAIWFLLVYIQTSWINAGNIESHKRVGRMSTYLAAGIVLSGIWVTLDHYERMADPVIVILNFFAMLNFFILYVAAYIKRNEAKSHKRLMIFASLAMILPALGRITQVLNIDPMTTVPAWLTLLIAVVIFDFRKMKKIHWSTLLGAGIIIVGIVLSIASMESQSVAAFIDATLGG